MWMPGAAAPFAPPPINPDWSVPVTDCLANNGLRCSCVET